MDYQGKTALILGLGESGLAMARWLARCGARLRVADTRAAPQRLEQLRAALPDAEFVPGDGAAFPASLLDGIDFAGVSPGLMPGRELAGLVPAAAARGIPLWGEIELFAQALAALRAGRGYAPKIIGITGTNGKTTVTSLTGLLCRRAGLTVQVAGNISPAALDVLRDDLERDCLPQAWILELSSFQLHSLHSLRADVATVLNVTQDHLDWHGSMDAYSADKARIFCPETVRVLNCDDPRVRRMATSLPTAVPAQPVASVQSATSAQSATTALSATSAQSETSASSAQSATTAQSTSSSASAAASPVASPARLWFGTAAPEWPGSFGLVSERGMTWLAVAEPAADADAKPDRRRRKSAAAEDQAPPPVTLKHLMPAAALKIHGQHNATNALAALALCRGIGLPFAPLLHGLREYAGESHRVELVGCVADVQYYDDSKGTNVGATLAALTGLGADLAEGARLLPILGGDGKGQVFGPLAEPVTRYARAVLLIGRDRPALREALAGTGVELVDCETLEQAVLRAAGLARAGDAVLLSPACASFDMFNNYLHRAQVFVDAVRGLSLAGGQP